MEEDIEILNIYNKIKKGKLPYCNICLKDGTETKLVKSRSLRLLFKGMGMEKVQMNPSSLICYMCDARATAAAAFISALEFAREIKVLFNAMNNTSTLEQQFRNCYKGQKRAAGSCRSLAKMFFRCENNLQLVQKRSELTQSQVLLVGSNNSSQRPRNIQTKERENGHKEAKKTDSRNLKAEIVISDDEDDDDVISIPTITPTPIEKLLDKPPTPPKPPPTIQNQPATNPIQIPNVVIPNVTIPNLVEQNEPQIQIIRSANNNLLINPQIVSQVIPQLILPQNPNQSVIHPIYQDPFGTILIPSLGGQIDKLGNFQPMQKVILQNVSFESLQKTEFVKKNGLKNDRQSQGRSNSKKVVEGSAEVEENVLVTPRIESVVSECVTGNDARKRSSQGSDDVDWEDRIPMDLISVMENPLPGTVQKQPVSQYKHQPQSILKDILKPKPQPVLQPQPRSLLPPQSDTTAKRKRYICAIENKAAPGVMTGDIKPGVTLPRCQYTGPRIVLVRNDNPPVIQFNSFAKGRFSKGSDKNNSR